MKKTTKPQPKAKVPRIVLVRVDSPALSLAQFREDENLVAEWRVWADRPIVQAMLQVMRNESPAHWLAEAKTADEKILLLGRIQGYEMAMNNLEALGALVQVQAPLTATFEKPQPLNELADE